MPLPLFCKGKRYLHPPMMFRENREGGCKPWRREKREEGGGRRQVLQYRGSPQTTKFLLSSRDPLILLCTVTAWREGRYDLPLPGEERVLLQCTDWRDRSAG